MKKIVLAFTGILAVALIAIASIYTFRPVGTASASVSQGSEYHSTTTPYVMTAPQLLQNGGGVLGSVVITGSGTGYISFYDATTTDRTKRGNTATTTIASFAASPTVGTYTFDAIYYNGLIVEVIGTSPTTTITYR